MFNIYRYIYIYIYIFIMQNNNSHCYIIFLKFFQIIFFWWKIFSFLFIFIYKWFIFCYSFRFFPYFFMIQSDCWSVFKTFIIFFNDKICCCFFDFYPIRRINIWFAILGIYFMMFLIPQSKKNSIPFYIYF